MNPSPLWDELRSLSQRGEIDEAICRCQKIIEELASRGDDAYPDTAQFVECLAQCYYDDGDYCAAAIEFQRALDIHRAHRSLPSDDVVRCLMFVGRTLLWTGRPAEAEERLSEALMLLDHLPEEEQVGRGFVLMDLAQLNRREKELETAERLLFQAIKPMLRFGYGNRHFYYVYFHLACVYEAQGRTSAEDRTTEKAIRGLRWAIDEDDDGFANVLSWNGIRLAKRGRLDEARACQVEALAILQRIRKPGHFLLEKVKLRLAKLVEPNV